ncbi:SCO family protein [Mucilaginibacter auburnensis]|uniref:Protein SCO1/2 n=1 Tax=Mucilaginibacter auburnensis TaxID=1457233 RepID=A0A2H9VSY4_9SPHI|nr:SCO family protein [Mucilaginibacter auburnensis]PJJ83912.1 protein SCO1/2 [Mucilaginibacter auburnensis]
MKISFKKVLILVVLLALPGFLYYLLTAKGKNRYKPLPVYGPKQVAKTGHKVRGKYVADTIYHQLPDFKLTDQDGKTVTSHSLDSSIFVANFFYTNCTGVCQTTNNNVKSLLDTYKQNKLVSFVSISVDPHCDSVGVLKQYAKQYNPAGVKWMFLTGDTTQIYPLARKGFLVNAVSLGNGDFIYSDKLILIDRKKRIRGYYSGTSVSEITRLNDEIKVLIAEELREMDEPLY